MKLRRRLALWLCRHGLHDLGGAVVSADVCPTCGYSRHERDGERPPTLEIRFPDDH